jgi:hypothetical protein
MESKKFDKSFEQLMSFLQNEHVIQETKTFLERNGVNIPVRKFLSFFMVYYHKDELLDQSKISMELYKQVKRTIRVYDSLREEYKEFKLRIFHYVVLETEKWFNIWKKKDKYELIMPMIHMYHHLEEQKNENQSWNEEIDKQKNLIQSKILRLDRNAQELIQNPPRVTINPEAKQNIVNVIHRAYWDKFQQNVKEKKWEQLIGFVDEIKQMLKNLVPHRNDLHIEMDNQIDSQILKQRLENNAISQEDIFKLMEYIVDWIRQFQAPADDQDTEEWWNHLQTQTSWDIMMRDFFMITFAKLDKIKIILYSFHTTH